MKNRIRVERCSVVMVYCICKNRCRCVRNTPYHKTNENIEIYGIGIYTSHNYITLHTLYIN